MAEMTRTKAKEYLGLSEQAFQYCIDTGMLTPQESGEFAANDLEAARDMLPFFSTAAAAAYLGMSVANLKYHVHVSGNLQPAKVGKSLVFSREQLDEFRQNGYSSIVPDITGYYSAEEAAEYLGLSAEAFGWHVRQRAVIGVPVGRSILYTKSALDDFAAEDVFRPRN